MLIHFIPTRSCISEMSNWLNVPWKIAITARFLKYYPLGPVLTYSHIFESATFSFRIRLSSTPIRRIRMRIRSFLNPLSRVEIFESANNLEPCGRASPDIFESDDVTKSGLVFIAWIFNMAAELNVVPSLLLAIISSLIVYVEVNVAMFTVHFSYCKRRLDILKLLSKWRSLSFLYHLVSLRFLSRIWHIQTN